MQISLLKDLPLDWEVISAARGINSTAAFIDVSVFEWWLLAGAVIQLNNGGGALFAGTIIQWSQQSTVVATVTNAISTAAGSSNNYFYGLGLIATNTTSGGNPTAPLPWLPIAGPGTLQFSKTDGDANSLIAVVTATIIGRLRTNKRS